MKIALETQIALVELGHVDIEARLEAKAGIGIDLARRLDRAADMTEQGGRGHRSLAGPASGQRTCRRAAPFRGCRPVGHDSLYATLCHQTGADTDPGPRALF